MWAGSPSGAKEKAEKFDLDHCVGCCCQQLVEKSIQHLFFIGNFLDVTRCVRKKACITLSGCIISEVSADYDLRSIFPGRLYSVLEVMILRLFRILR